MTVPGIALTSNNVGGRTVVTATDRDTGKPLEDVTVQIFRKDHKSASYRGITDKDGQVSFLLSDRYYRNRLVATKNGDTITTYVNRSYYSEPETDSKRKVSAFIYLDRAIYRPGQKVYFKSILVSQQNEKSSVMSNEELEMVVTDVNGISVTLYLIEVLCHFDIIDLGISCVFVANDTTTGFVGNNIGLHL